MGREVKRVPLVFDWPVGKIWEGYLMPQRLRGDDCPDCESGYSPGAERLNNYWYGYNKFDPSNTGSVPHTIDTPGVRAFAERNVKNSLSFYGAYTEANIVREANRLLDYWNGQWCHHLHQRDVDVLVAENRLPVFDGRIPTVKEVNVWSLFGIGHDLVNSHIVITAECERLGISTVCQTCNGSMTTERWPGQCAQADAWRRVEPPSGDAYQMWSTTSEGNPMTPPFATPEELAQYCVDNQLCVFADDTASYEEWLSIITGETFAHKVISPGVVIM